MQTQIIDGRKIKDEILSEVKRGIEALSFPPVFCDILVGNDLVSTQYVKIKAKNAEAVGIKFRTAEFDVSITTEELVNEIESLNKVPHMCGIIVQLPLPEHIDKQRVLDTIAQELDVDCLGNIASSNFYNNKSDLGFPTALACMKVLDSLNLDLKDKKFVVLGQGSLVGRPVAYLLKNRGFNVDIINSKTDNFKELILNANVIISAIGRVKFITGDIIKKDVIIIDAGTSEEDGGIVGDVDLESVKDIASFVSSTPGGVGPVTVAMLLNNILKVAQKKY